MAEKKSDEKSIYVNIPADVVEAFDIVRIMTKHNKKTAMAIALTDFIKKYGDKNFLKSINF